MYVFTHHHLHISIYFRNKYNPPYHIILFKVYTLAILHIILMDSFSVNINPIPSVRWFFCT